MDLMAIRRGIIASQQAGLPAEYQRVEYLECSGTQYILTNYIAPEGVSAECEYMFTATVTGDKMICGSSDGTNMMYLEKYGTSWYCANNYAKWGPALAETGMAIGTKYKLLMDSTSLTIGEYSTPPISTGMTVSNKPIAIFSYNRMDSITYIHSALRIYKLTFRNNGVLSANFVPCIRKSDSEAGMYDTVSKTFYTNAGTGSFIIPS